MSPTIAKGEAEVEPIDREAEVKDMNRNRQNIPWDETIRIIHSRCSADT